MKKNSLTGVVAAVVVLAAGYLGATAYTGQRVASAYEARLDKVEKQFPFLHLVDRQADRGLFSSTFTTGVTLGCATGPDAFVVRFRDHVRHGPFPGFDGFGAAEIDSEILLPAGAPEAVRSYLASLKPGDLRTRVAYDGSYRTVARLPAGEMSGSGIKAKWPEARITGSGSFDGAGANRYEASLPELSVEHSSDERTSSLRLVGVALRGETQGNTQGSGGNPWLQSGTNAWEVGKVELRTQSGDDPVSLDLAPLKYTASVDVDKDLFGGKAAITTSAVLKIGRDAKPVQIDDIEFQESFQRLYGPALQKLSEDSLTDMSVCGAAGDSDPDAQAAQMAKAQERMTAVMMQMLPHDPSISLDKLSLRFGGQPGQLSYSAGVQGFEPKPNENLMDAMPRIVQALTVKADASFPAAWIRQLGALGQEDTAAAGAGAGVGAGAGAGVGMGTASQRFAQADAMLDIAAGKGFIVRNGDDISTHFVMEHGVGTLNGKPFGAPRK